MITEHAETLIHGLLQLIADVVGILFARVVQHGVKDPRSLSGNLLGRWRCRAALLGHKGGDLLPADLYDPMRELMDDPRPMLDALEKYPRTLIHGDFRAENLAYTDRPVLLDWQEAAYTLPTADLVWFLRDESFSPEYGRFEAEVYYRQRLEWHLGARFANEEWQAMLDLGYGIDALRAAGFYGMFVIMTADNTEFREHDEWFIHFHAHNVQKALRWL